VTVFVRCRECLIPTTRPDTAFVQGICSACINHKKRAEIDWAGRLDELVSILKASKNGTGFDCIVPSSGGKDSTYQVLRIIELGFRPLVVTASTCMLTDVGRKNIDNLARYATTIEVTPSREVRRKLNRLGLELVGDVSLPEHWSIFSTPFRIAADLGIPTLIYGECPQEAYGGPIGTEAARTMTRRWTSEFGGYLGLRPQDMVGTEGISHADMLDYMLPSDEKLSRVTAYWLGQYEEWSTHRNLERSADAGMIQQLPCLANWWEGENQDSALTGLHDHAMYRKYGYGRGCAQISVDIRNDEVSRPAAMAWIMEFDGRFPFIYMDTTIWQACDHLGLSFEKITASLDKHTNRSLFSWDGVKDARPILKEFASKSEHPKMRAAIDALVACGFDEPVARELMDETLRGFKPAGTA
jgi:N-acetyl sugar amidotransferase